MTGYYFIEGRTTPFTSLITISGVLVTLSFLLGVLALLADMLGRHRKISEELLYLARRKVYAGKRTPHRPVMASVEPARAVARLFEESWGVESARSRMKRLPPGVTPVGDDVRLVLAPATSHEPTRLHPAAPARLPRASSTTPNITSKRTRPARTNDASGMRCGTFSRSPELRFLDLGCGAGWATRLAKVEGNAKHAVGLDFSRTALVLARTHTPQILWVQADGTALPIADGIVRPTLLQRRAGAFPRRREGPARDRPHPAPRRDGGPDRAEFLREDRAADGIPHALLGLAADARIGRARADRRPAPTGARRSSRTRT